MLIRPQQPEPDEPGSVEYSYQVWRQQRNENVINETRTQAEVAGETGFHIYCISY